MKLIATDTKVQIKWFVYSMGEKMRHNSTMRGTWGWDAECSCGGESKTGGAIRSSVATDVEMHKRIAHNYRYELSMNWEDYSKAGA
jgi:hypothetical protein